MQKKKIAHETLIIGGKVQDDASAFIDAWHRANSGQHVRERTLAFENRAMLINIALANILL